MSEPSLPSVPYPLTGLGRRSSMTQWATLLAMTAGLVAALSAVHLPAAFLLGALLAGIAAAVWGARVGVSDWAIALAQGMVGVMIARMLPPLSGAGGDFAHWPAFVLGVLAVVTAATVLGWAMVRWKILPGSTALWGLSPGAATAMVLMAEAYGADTQLVAMMQYVRVVLVTLIASLIAGLVGLGGHPVDSGAVTWFPPLSWPSLAATLGLIVLGPVVAHLLRLRGGAMLLPLVIGTVLSQSGWLTITLPPWLLAIGYAGIGWRVGLRFSRPLLRHALRKLPSILLCVLLLIALCGGIAGLLMVFADVDPLTAYLATSPGGADTVAILTASSTVDAPFVMSMQMARFLTILVIGPAVARFFCPPRYRAEPWTMTRR